VDDDGNVIETAGIESFSYRIDPVIVNTDENSGSGWVRLSMDDIREFSGTTVVEEVLRHDSSIVTDPLHKTQTVVKNIRFGLDFFE